MRLRPIGAREAVVLILAASVAGALVSLAIAASIAEASRNAILSEAATSLLSTVLGATIGVLAAYVSRDGGSSANDSSSAAGEKSAAGDEAAGGR